MGLVLYSRLLMLGRTAACLAAISGVMSPGPLTGLVFPTRVLTTLVVAVTFAATTEAGMAATEVPPAPTPPRNFPAPGEPIFEGSLSHQPGWREAFLGVGRLGPADPESFWTADWLVGVLIPLYDAPDGPHQGMWIASGWLLRGEGPPLALSTRAMVETGYERLSFLVLEAKPDGWLRILLATKPDSGVHSAWVHGTHLAGCKPPLAYAPWERFFLRGRPSRLHFRSPEVPHALRSDPSSQGELLTWIRGGPSLEPIEVSGTWIRVRVRQPSDECIPAEEWHGTSREGWIRWWDEERGPWVWFHSRGC